MSTGRFWYNGKYSKVYLHVFFFNKYFKKASISLPILGYICSDEQTELPSLVFTSVTKFFIFDMTGTHERMGCAYIHIHLIFHCTQIFTQESSYKVCFSNYQRHTITVWVPKRVILSVMLTCLIYWSFCSLCFEPW